MAHKLRVGRLALPAVFRLAWRNLLRNRRRTLITATTVAVAVMLLETVVALMIGLENKSFDNLIHYQTAHAKLFADGYFEKREDYPLDYTLPNIDSLQTALRSIKGVAASTPRLVFSAQVSNGVDQISCLGTGIQIQGSDSDVFRLPQAIVEGTYLAEGEDGLLVGAGLAAMFEVGAGDWLTILTKTRAGAYEALDLPVVGLLGTGNPLIDQNSVLLPLETAREMLDMPDGATEIAVRFAVTARQAETMQQLRAGVTAGDGFVVKGWREIEEDFMSLVRLKRTGQTIMLGIFIVLAVVGVTNTILMATFERTREIGTLMAMGLRPGGIRRLFLLEGALTGLIGGALGSAAAFGVIFWMAQEGINFSSMFGDMDIGYPVNDAVYPSLRAGTFLWTWLVTGAFAALASLYPAARASRQQPVEALRHV